MEKRHQTAGHSLGLDSLGVVLSPRHQAGVELDSEINSGTLFEGTAMTFSTPAVTTIVLVTAVTSLLLAGCSGGSSTDGSKGWQCTAQDVPGGATGGPRLYHRTDAEKEIASEKAMKQCKLRSAYAATCNIENCVPR